MNAPSRLDTSPLARWWWTVDRSSIGITFALVTIGVILLIAAGPGAAERMGIGSPFHFLFRQLLFLPLAIVLMLAVSTLSPLQARRTGAVIFVGSVLLCIAALIFAPEINGARRWFSIGPFGLQPSEFLKPGFVVVAAWMLAEGARDPKFPGAAIAMACFGVSAGLLVLQPDYGQASLLAGGWMAMFFIAGASLIWLGAIAAAAIGVIVAGYFLSPHIAARIDVFLNPESGNSYQVRKALEAIGNGGAFGRWGDGAAVKHSLPDAHTDFIFAVASEEFGLLAGFLILGLYAALVMRAYVRASAMKSVFVQTTVCGLATIIGLQSFLNIAVNLRALPAKGVTLPFISYGGSSLLATALSLGLILALTRRTAGSARRKELMP